MRRICAFWAACIAFIALSLCAARAEAPAAPRKERALLIGVDEFVTKPSAYPSSTNNVYAMQAAFQASLHPLDALYLPETPVTDAAQLAGLIRHVFHGARDGDVSYLYISTHGVYDPAGGEEPRLLLSDGVKEGSITPAQLEAAFDGIKGTKVLIIDACNSGAFIGKGLDVQPDDICFLGGDFKVLTSSGAMEESWYWSANDSYENDIGKHKPQGAFYFTQALAQGISPAYGYPADGNHDGSVTLSELYGFLLNNHAASTPHVYPQSDDFVVFSYDLSEPPPAGDSRSPIMDVTFSNTTLSKEQSELQIEFIAVRPVRVAYQIVYQHEGKWEFQTSQLIYDEAERFTALGSREGAVSAGRKVRTLRLNELAEDAFGYILVQLVSIDNGRLTVHAGRVVCVPPETGELGLMARTRAEYSREGGRELEIFVGHEFPCELSVSVVDENGVVVRRICHRTGTRPMQMGRSGSVFYWDGRLKNGENAPAGSYQIRAQAAINGETVTVYSDMFDMD